MDPCKYVTKEMLPGPIEVLAEGEPVDFATAKGLAYERAVQVLSEPMLLAWFDRNRGKYSPDVVCCDYDKPTWLVYAESRGGRISIDVNNLDYVFVYREGNIGA
jgi:hypothetical protein